VANIGPRISVLTFHHHLRYFLLNIVSKKVFGLNEINRNGGGVELIVLYGL